MDVQPARAQRPAEIRALGGARALPPLVLVLFHYHEGHGYQHLPWFDIPVAKGYLWVEFFFALSGFVLIHVYGRRMDALWTRKGYFEFLVNRLARLYPVHLAMLLVLLAHYTITGLIAAHGGFVAGHQPHVYQPNMTPITFLANLLLVQAWNLFHSLSWNTVAWFVSVEFFLCLIFPLYAWMATGGPLRAVLLIFLGFAALHRMAQVSGHGLDITYDYGLVRGMADFAIGVGLAMLYRDARAHTDKLPETAFTAAQAAIALWFVYAMYHTGWSHNLLDFWIVPPMTLFILTIAFDRGLLSRAFQFKPLRTLGEWSFAIYMGQTLWLSLLHNVENTFYPNPAPAWDRTIHWLEPAVLVALSILWGWVLYRTVESPANSAIRAWFRGVKARDTRAA